MIFRPHLTSSEIDAIMATARGFAEAQALAVTICIVDDGGHVLRLDRLDGAPLISLRVAEGKARTALELRMPTGLLEPSIAAMPSMIAIADFYPFRGGVPLFHQGQCVGAIGVSGAAPEQDEETAQRGADSLGVPD
ncbi:hypothetical protein CA262_05370 [Sphingobium sp. GW456-12-10-14-TSB1]|uniref:GlcG/HbpS family heme-binding protein n=1 Tax=Sphingobium sp. GW456-12-10-14-TSB1 TaxID=1987165 RepID=UPI000A36818C|nr:heme-binding protein [Sphingobium sp. GW456-12-10-14-TSB1]OUC54358.1 hypothetical protein CA262_05370 [Sphingobium sp. GW456-12-10-14-TSB1]